MKTSAFSSGQGLGLIAALAAAMMLALLTQPAAAHSWVEQVMRIAPNGTLVGAIGYPRGYTPRSPTFHDDSETWLLPPNGRPDGKVIHPDDKLCHPFQMTSNYSAAFPKLTASPGDFIALRYQENGHVTLPDVNPTKPLNRGTVYIYGTTQPSESENFADVFDKWTADGTGGNGKGRLLATRNFDDGQCYQINGGDISVQRQAAFKKVAEDPQGADLWCQNDFQLPSDAEAGKDLTLYWVWSWPSMNAPGAPTDVPDGKFTVAGLQYYTSCMDVSVASSGSGGGATNNVAVSFAASFAKGQDLNNAAVLAQLTAGNFMVDVANATATADAGASSPAATATATTATTTSSSGGKKGGNGIKTVTVTDTVATVTTTVWESTSPAAATAAATTTIAAAGQGSNSATSTTAAAAAAVTQTPGDPPQVRPFLPTRRVRREAGEWALRR